jgi:hypothetical protein
MAVSAAAKTATGLNADQTSYLTTSQTPTANKLQLIGVASSRASAPASPTLSGCSLTWVLVGSILYKPVATPNHRISVFRALGASPTTGQVTMDFAGVTQVGAAWEWVEVDGMDTSGTNGSGAIVQAVTDRGDSDPAPEITLSAFGDVANGTIGFFASEDGVTATWTVNPGWTDLGGGTGSYPRSRAIFKNNNDTTVGITLNSQDWGGVGLEIKAAAAPGGITGDFAQNIPALAVAFSGSVVTTGVVERQALRHISAQQAIQRAHWW